MKVIKRAMLVMASGLLASSLANALPTYSYDDATNLLSNGSFEQNDVPTGGWRWFAADDVNGWDGDNIEIWDDLKGIESAHGDQHAELNAHPTQANSFSIFQSFATEKDATYQLSFQYRARNPKSNDAFSFGLDGTVLTEIINSQNDWTEAGLSFVGTGDTMTFLFTSLNPGNDTTGNLLDAVYLSKAGAGGHAVPEPSSVALLALGLIGLTVLRKRSV